MMTIRYRNIRRPAGSIALAALLLCLGETLLPAAAAQNVKFGSVSGTAVKARIELTARRIILTGDVDVKTNDGDRLQANKIVLTLNANRTDVETAEATGNVSLVMRRNVQPKGSAAYIQVITASANQATFNNDTRQAQLSGNVNGKADDPFMLTTFRAATVNIDLTPSSEVIEAEGTAAQKAQVNYQSKVQPKPAAGVKK